MTAALARNFEAVLGPLNPATVPDAVRAQVSELALTHTSEEWLLKPGRLLRRGRRVKIAAGIEVIQRMHKAPGGLIRATVEMQHGQLVGVALSGDFFFYPASLFGKLEQCLMGAAQAEVEGAIEEFYRTNGVESPGVTPHDLAIALGAE
jgi:lipoate-protein ligase A